MPGRLVKSGRRAGAGDDKSRDLSNDPSTATKCRHDHGNLHKLTLAPANHTPDPVLFLAGLLSRRILVAQRLYCLFRSRSTSFGTVTRIQDTLAREEASTGLSCGRLTA